MPDPSQKAKEYSFWRWEYLRRNRKYLANFEALNKFLLNHGIVGVRYPAAQEAKDFRLQDIFVTPFPLDSMSIVDLSDRMNRILERFNILPVAPWEGSTSDKLVKDAIEGTIDYEICPASYRPGYRLDEKTARPVFESTKKQRHLEHDAIISKEDYFKNQSKESLEEWKSSLLELEFENIPSKKFRSNEIARAVGLWIWDRVPISPKQEANSESRWSAIRELYRQHPVLSTIGLGAIEAGNNDNPESTFRKISGYYLATADCISRHEVLPIKK